MYTFGREPLRLFLFANKCKYSGVVKMEAPTRLLTINPPGHSHSFFLPFLAFLLYLAPASRSPRVCETTSYRPFSVLFTVDFCLAGGRRPDGLEHWLTLPCIHCAQRQQLRYTSTMHSHPLKEPWWEARNIYKLSLQIHGGRKNKRGEKGDSSAWICSSIL